MVINVIDNKSYQHQHQRDGLGKKGDSDFCF